ncbi:fimbrial protein [Serratia aquatilis]|uniref:Fimbrial protein n=1 Tax=Serratia aquatilis TaxID=1737515 RepID=A0ABV6EC45_9GAMM
MRMWQQIIGTMLLCWCSVASTAEIALGGVPVSISLTNLPKITVEKPGGGWYDTMTLSNSTGSDVTRYQAQVPVQVSIRNEHNFQVSLVNPLVLTHTANPSLTFTTEMVGFGSTNGQLQALSATPVDFSNPPATGDTSTGSYLLSVSARQPLGVLGTISGNYLGQLVLLFEVKV